MSATELLEQARTARRAGDLPECILKASAAASAAEQEHNAETEYHAHACLARLHLSREEPSDALVCFKWALDAALRGGLSHWMAPAYHDVYIASREAGHDDAMTRWGAAAFTIYRDSSPNHVGFTGLIADFAEDSLDRETNKKIAARSWEQWRCVPGLEMKPHYRLNAAVGQMRAAAILGVGSKYKAACDTLEEIFVSLPHHEHAARSMTDAANAALHMRDFERSASLAGRAKGIAEGRGEGRVAERATEALDNALAERSALA